MVDRPKRNLASILPAVLYKNIVIDGALLWVKSVGRISTKSKTLKSNRLPFILTVITNIQASYMNWKGCSEKRSQIVFKYRLMKIISSRWRGSRKRLKRCLYGDVFLLLRACASL